MITLQFYLLAEYLNLGDANVSTAPGVVVNKEESVTPRCWKTVYYLLDLYATMPETKTIAHRLLYNFIFYIICLTFYFLLVFKIVFLLIRTEHLSNLELFKPSLKLFELNLSQTFDLKFEGCLAFVVRFEFDPSAAIPVEFGMSTTTQTRGFSSVYLS